MTITTVQFTNSTLQLYLDGENVGLFVDQVYDIISEYEAWNDTLSNKIRNWFVGFQKTLQDKNVDLKLSHAKAKIAQLRDCILVCIATRKPLINPQLEQSRWTWENEALLQFQAKSAYSPFNGKLITAVVHEFALKMIQWIHNFPYEIESVIEEQKVLHQKEMTVIQNDIQSVRNLRAELTSLKEQMTQIILEAPQKQAEGLQALQEQQERQAEESRVALEEIKTEQAKTHAILIHQQELLQARLDEEARRINEQAQELLNKEALIQQQQATINGMARRMNNMGRKKRSCIIS